jgi:acetolactate synthase I/II/III large subunit
VNGAASLIATVAGAGVEVCFANPGTTEMHLVEALDEVGGMRAVLGLFEGVCAGAADGYARMAGRPALALLHLGPGLANGLANLHNAAKAGTPVLAVVGDHPTWHRGRGAPLEADVEGFARPVCTWVRTSATAAGVARDASEALVAASTPPGGVATLVVPADCAWGEADGAAPAAAPSARTTVSDAAIEAAAARVRAGATVLLGGSALGARGLRAAGRMSHVTGCRLLAETFPARMERGGDLPAVARLPYFPEDATAALAKGSALVLAGAAAPVAFFGYPELPSELAPPGLPVEVLADRAQDAADALERLAEHVGAGTEGATSSRAAPEPEPDGPLTLGALARVVAAGQPDGAIVVDEGLTASEAYVLASARAARHSLLAVTGGSIGFGPPCATGAAVACPDRPVILLQADGSAMYTLQALWTQAREGLDVTTLLCANHSYAILRIELARAGVTEPGPRAAAMTDLADPRLDWVALASGMGVPARRATTTHELAGALAQAIREPGPHLIEMAVAGP